MVFLGLMAGVSGCGSVTPLPVEATSPVPAQSQISSSQPLCTQLDYTGDPARPDSATLTCEDGDKIVIPGPIEEGATKASTIVSGQGAVADKSGPLFILSESGEHYVWHYVMVNGELRVFHDDQRIQRHSTGETRSSKIAIRNFKDSAIGTIYQGW
ncbi:hypothetical protein D3C73_17150 [compost metagenome]